MFTKTKEGDKVTRMVGGQIPMLMEVVAVEGELLLCKCIEPGAPSADAAIWAFDRATGVEEDKELGWGVAFGATGSYLVPPKE